MGLLYTDVSKRLLEIVIWRSKKCKPLPPTSMVNCNCHAIAEQYPAKVQKYCKIAVESISCGVRDTSHMLEIIDDINEMGVLDEDMLVSFDIINMFPSIDNKTGVERVRSKLMEVLDRLGLPVECIIKALEICLTKNFSAYRGQYWLQKNGTAMGPKNACSYADIVAEYIDKKSWRLRLFILN